MQRVGTCEGVEGDAASIVYGVMAGVNGSGSSHDVPFFGSALGNDCCELGFSSWSFLDWSGWIHTTYLSDRVVEYWSVHVCVCL